jgi:hypothetical protein
MKREWAKNRTYFVARPSQIVRAFAVIIVATLLTAASCSAKTGTLRTSTTGAQSSPTPTPFAIPKLKVAPFEPTM